MSSPHTSQTVQRGSPESLQPGVLRRGLPLLLEVLRNSSARASLQRFRIKKNTQSQSQEKIPSILRALNPQAPKQLYTFRQAHMLCSRV